MLVNISTTCVSQSLASPIVFRRLTGVNLYQYVNLTVVHFFAAGFLGDKWKKVYCKLYKDSAFFWFKEKDDPTSKGNCMLSVGKLSEKICFLISYTIFWQWMIANQKHDDGETYGVVRVLHHSQWPLKIKFHVISF